MSTHFGRITVRVIHAEPIIAAGVMYALSSEADMDVAAVGLDARQSADVFVTDLPTGLRLAGELRRAQQRSSSTRVLVVAAHDREFEVHTAMKSGVQGYLLASCGTSELIQGVRAVGSGARYISMAVARRVADSMSREQLTARELEVLRLLLKGNCNKSIAQELIISLGTVKAHVKAILAKLGARSRTHAVSLAVERGLVIDELAMVGTASREPSGGQALRPQVSFQSLRSSPSSTCTRTPLRSGVRELPASPAGDSLWQSTPWASPGSLSKAQVR